MMTKKRVEYDTYGKNFRRRSRGRMDTAKAVKGSAVLITAISLPKTDKDLNLISGIFLKTFRPTREAEGLEQKEARTLPWILSISFEDSIFETERKILLSKVSYCSVCKGSGAEPGSGVEKCSACQGAGKIHESRRSIFGAVSSFRECSKCSGKGTIQTKKMFRLFRTWCFPKRRGNNGQCSPNKRWRSDKYARIGRGGGWGAWQGTFT